MCPLNVEREQTFFSRLCVKKNLPAILEDYRDAIITKKLSSMAFYKYGLEWDGFMKKKDEDFLSGWSGYFKDSQDGIIYPGYPDSWFGQH